MSDAKFANDLQTYRDFLEELHATHNKTKLRHYLSTADLKELQLLVRIVHKTVRGEFPLKSVHFEKLVAAKRLPYLQRTFQDTEDHAQLHQLDKRALLKKLYYIVGIIPDILNTVLN